MKPNVLLVQGDTGRGAALAEALSSRFDCLRVTTFGEALAAISRRPWAAVVAGCDPADGGTGLQILQVARSSLPRAFRILCPRDASAGFHRDAARLGWLHHVGDVSTADLAATVTRVVAELLEPPPLELPADLPPILTDEIVTRSPLVREFLDQLRAAAERDVPVYVYGEPGSGVTRSGVLLRRWRGEWKERGSPGTADGVAPVCILRMPPVRERLQDLPLLAGRCLLEDSRQKGQAPHRLSAAAVNELLGRPWFGNVVELASVIARAVRRAGARAVIEAEDLPKDTQPDWHPSQRAKDDGQRDCVLRQLCVARNVSTAARLEGCSRANYIRLMRRLGIIRADASTGVALKQQDAAAGLSWRAPRRPVSASPDDA